MECRVSKYDEQTAWLRENHRAQTHGSTAGDQMWWSCSCGAYAKQRDRYDGPERAWMKAGHAKAAVTRHLRAHAQRWMREYEAQQDALYLDHVRRNGEVEDAARTML